MKEASVNRLAHGLDKALAEAFEEVHAPGRDPFGHEVCVEVVQLLPLGNIAWNGLAPV